MFCVKRMAASETVSTLSNGWQIVGQLIVVLVDFEGVTNNYNCERFLMKRNYQVKEENK